MTPEEIEKQLEELETRLDRLRALYEQYFLGIERTEPFVQKKDVERRFQQLRAVQIRNTALRFRFQTLVQRYTTYLTYWQRITRQIEEGTFQRDLIRAQRVSKTKDVHDRDREHHEEVYELDADAIEEIEDIEEIEAFQDLSDGVTKDGEPEREITARDLPFDVVETARGPAAVPRPTERIGQLPAISRPTQTSPGAPSIASSASTAQTPAPTRTASAPITGASAPSVMAKPQGAPPAPSERGPTSVGKSASSVARSPGLSPFAGPMASTRTSVPAGTNSTETGNTQTPSSPSQRTVASAARPATAVTTARSNAFVSSSDDPALRALYERYRESRRRNGESDVPFEVVARQVRDTLPKLQEKYPGQDITFDVTVKDGKTLLRPVVRPKK